MKYDESRVILACNLLEYRTINGISQEELAFRIKTSVKSYAKIERAEVHTNLKNLDRLSQATGISTAQLLTPFFAVQPSKDDETDQTNQV